MPYTEQQWHDDTTTAPYGPINGTRLNYMEAGIGTAQATAEAALAAGGGAGIGTALPLVDGTASAGAGTVSSAVDHVHPTDTSRAPLASPTFSGTPSLPTATVGVTQSAADSSLKLATTAFVTTADNLKAPLASPTFTGTATIPNIAGPTVFTGTATVPNIAGPTIFTGTATIPNIAGPTTLSGTVTLPSTTIATTPSANDNSTKPATTAYVDTADALKAPLASPTFTGTVTLPSVPATALVAATKSYSDYPTMFPFGSNSWTTLAQPANSSTTTGNANDVRWVQVTWPVTGTLDGLWVNINTTGNNSRLGIFDTGQALSSATCTLLYIGTATANGAAGTYLGYTNASSPALSLSVVKGVTARIFWTCDNTTGKIISFGAQQAGQGTPPAGTAHSSSPGTADQKLWGTIATANMVTTVGQTVSDANMATGSAVQPVFVLHITPA